MTDNSEIKTQIIDGKERKPPICERYTGCIFFNDNMTEKSEDAEDIKDKFCRSNFPKCARYILLSRWKIKAPDDMYPYQTARAQAILDATLNDQKMVIPTSEELAAAQRTIKLMFDALGHGFMVFDKHGKCLPTYSKACESLLEIEPEGKHISDVLHLDKKQTESMSMALKLVFNQTHAMSFEEVMRFAPKVYHHSSGAIIKLIYKPDRLQTGVLDHIVVIASDITEQVHQTERGAELKALFETLERVLHDRAFFGSYVRRLNEMLCVLSQKGTKMTWEALRREIHTLKGDAGLFRLNKLADALHDLETHISPYVTQNPTQEALGGDAPCCEKIAASCAIVTQELAKVSDYLLHSLGVDVTKIEGERSFNKKVLYQFAQTLLDQQQPELYRTYMTNVCCESLQGYLSRYDMILQDFSLHFSKKVKPIVFETNDVPVLMDGYCGLFDSFIHIFRNAIDHGIERADVRAEHGKPEEALLRISTVLGNVEDKEYLTITIQDDGAGIDLDKLRQKLKASEPSQPWLECSDEDVYMVLLTQNISSRDTVNLYSGRGVGVSAVYAQVQKLGGTMTLKSESGKGTCITVKIPYVLDIPQG